MEFGKIYSRYWAWALKKKLTDKEKIIGAYLLSSQHSNSLGCYRLPMAYAAVDLGYPIETVSIAFEKFEKMNFIRYCDGTDTVLVVKYLKWNKIQNPMHGKGTIRMAMQIPKDFKYWDLLIESIQNYAGGFVEQDSIDTLYNRVCKPYQDGLKTVSIGYGDKEKGKGKEKKNLSTSPEEAPESDDEKPFLDPEKKSKDPPVSDRPKNDKKLIEKTNELASKIYKKDVFPKVYGFINKMRNQFTNENAINHSLTSYIENQPWKKPNHDPWGYCLSVIQVENGNYNEQEFNARVNKLQKQSQCLIEAERSGKLDEYLSGIGKPMEDNA